MSEEEKKPESGFKAFCKAILNFLKETDIEVSVKNPNVAGKVSKGDNSFTVGLGQDGSETSLEYKDNKVKVSHETKVAEEKTDDTEIS